MISQTYIAYKSYLKFSYHKRLLEAHSGKTLNKINKKKYSIKKKVAKFIKKKKKNN